MTDATLLDIGPGGALVRWPTPAAIPDEVELEAGGHCVARVRVLRPLPAALPRPNPLDAAAFIRRWADAPPPGTGAGLSPRDGVAGEATPFAAADDPAEWDLTDALGLADYAPPPAAELTLTLDIAQRDALAELALRWLDADGQPISQVGARRARGPAGGTAASGYAALRLDAVPPPGTARLRVLLLHEPDRAGSLLFFRRPRLASAANPAPPSALGTVPLGDALILSRGPLSIRLGETVLPLPPLDAPATPAARWTLALDGARMTVEGPADATPADPPMLAVDGLLVTPVPLLPLDGRATGHAALPPHLFDGAEHWVSLIGGTLGETLAAGPMPFPAAGPAAPDPAHPAAAPFAAERYAALVATLARPAAAEWLSEVVAAHDELVRGSLPDPAPRRMPSADAPDFSVVIPAHDRFDLTHRCLLAVLLTCAGLSFETVVVDDGSADRTTELERRWPGVSVVRHAEALGFVRAANAGMAAARGRWLALLNNDTEPAGRWLEELHLPFRAFADVGATGARLVYPDGQLQDAGGLVGRDGRPANMGHGGNPAAPAHNYARAADYLSGAALMVSRAAWERVGGFSEDYAPAYFEDTDLAFRLREAGYSTLYAPKAMVVHREGASHGTDAHGEGHKRFQRLNAARFAGRWRPTFRSHDADPDRAAVARALVVDQRTPRPDRDAGSAAICQEMRMLQTLGWKLAFASADMSRDGGYSDALERAGVELAHAPFHPTLPQLIAARGREFDLFYLHRWSSAAGLIPLIRAHAPHARVAVNCADVHFLREMRAARARRSDEDFAAALATRTAELAVLAQADAVLSYSDVERGVLEALLPADARVLALPFVGPDPVAAPVPLAERRDLAFLGSYDHPPNRDAVRVFLSDVWPALRERFPELRLRIAGSGFERFRPDLPDERVDLLGHVPDALAFLGSARVAVAPLVAGAGVKGKLVDALAAATPSVATPVAAEGLGLGADPAVRVARTADEWVAALSELLTDDRAWTRASAACAPHAGRRTFAAGLTGMRAILTELGLPFDEPGRPAAQRVPAPILPYDRLRKPD